MVTGRRRKKRERGRREKEEIAERSVPQIKERGDEAIMLQAEVAKARAEAEGGMDGGDGVVVSVEGGEEGEGFGEREGGEFLEL